MLNELSIKNNSCLYVSAIKMFNYFFRDVDDVLEAHEIWDWKTVDFLLIDDICPCEPIQDELTSPKQVLSFIDTLKPINRINREIIKNKNIIWILGTEQSLVENKKDKWEDLLLDIGIDKSKISIINL